MMERRTQAFIRQPERQSSKRGNIDHVVINVTDIKKTDVSVSMWQRSSDEGLGRGNLV